ncbi:hypothetical protein ACFVT2_11095 [Streptomyces sp. NPDC058000]|uniref:hypothetical protein n=1 Tax=Streptomyces sp. NPDC058000 TaxID=3346299 RepID=UPI0036F05845
MHKLYKAAVLAAALGSIGVLGAGTAHAGGRGGNDFKIGQGSSCRSHDLNVDVLGEVGILNGLLGNALNGEGSPGAQATSMGSRIGCDNSFGGRGGDEGGRGGDEGGRGGDNGGRGGDEGGHGGNDGGRGGGEGGRGGDM